MQKLLFIIIFFLFPFGSLAQKMNITLSGGISSHYERHSLDCCALQKKRKEGRTEILRAIEAPAITIAFAGKRMSFGIGSRYYFHTKNPALAGNTRLIKYLAYGFGRSSNIELAYNRKYWSVLGTAGLASPGVSGYLNHLHAYAGLGAELKIPILKEEGQNISLVLRGEHRNMNTLKLLGHLDERAGWDFKGPQNIFTVGLRININPRDVMQRRIQDDWNKVQRRQQQELEEEEI